MNSSILEIVTAEISFLSCFSKNKTYPKNKTQREFPECPAYDYSYAKAAFLKFT